MILNSRKRRQLRQQHNKAVKLYHIWREQEGDPATPIALGSIAQLDSKRFPKPHNHQKVSSVQLGVRAGMSRLPESNSDTPRTSYIPMLDMNWYRQFKKTLEAKA